MASKSKVPSSKFQVPKAKEDHGLKDSRPTIAQLLAVIAEYNKAHELDLAELNTGAVPVGKNVFLHDLYFAAAAAAKALGPVMRVHLEVVQGPNSKFQIPNSNVLKTPMIVPETLAALSRGAATDEGKQ